MEQSIIIHYGEIGLKGKNQADFRRQLRENIRRRLRTDGLGWKPQQTRGYLYIDVPPDQTNQMDTALNAITDVAGIVWYAPASYIPTASVNQEKPLPDFPQLEEELIRLANKHYAPDRAFCVRVNRGYKQFPMTSPALERHFGTVINKKTEWEHVDLEEPDITFRLDITSDRTYLFTGKRRGIGGLPVGSTGRVLSLLSGGIDSPVAAYLMAKRGCSLDFIHFTATAMQQQEATEYKVSALAKELSKITMRSRLYLVPYTHFEFDVMGENQEYELMVFRRFMANTAERLAEDIGSQALVTGDNLGQVASQTLENIVSNSRAVHLPILRPLLTYDKQQIVNLAREIGTYETSIEPYKDCCSLISEHPKTTSYHQELNWLEDDIISDYDQLINDTLNDAICLVYDCGELVETRDKEVWVKTRS